MDHFELPRCRYCGRKWRPKDGVVASESYCSACASDRLRAASAEHGLAPLEASDLIGRYLPRRARRAI